VRQRALASVSVQPAAVISGIRPFTALPEKLLRDQWDAALASGPLDACLFADLGNADRVSALAEWLHDAPQLQPRVLDPDLTGPKGEARHARAMAATVANRLLDRVDLVVVDAGDLRLLTGRDIEDLADLREGARRLFDRGAKAVLATGGRLEGHPIDYLFEGRDFVEFGDDRVRRAHLVGAGATLSALLTGHIARGLGLVAAVAAAKAGVTLAIKRAQPDGETWAADALGLAFEALGLDPAPLVPHRDELV
jgi:hydroxymethylpyrimidine/phosphomethylpyrimidine kinase